MPESSFLSKALTRFTHEFQSAVQNMLSKEFPISAEL